MGGAEEGLGGYLLDVGMLFELFVFCESVEWGFLFKTAVF